MSDDRQITRKEEKLEDFSQELTEKMRLSVSKEEFLDQVKRQVALDREIKPERKIKGMVNTLTRQTRQIRTNVQFRDVGTVQHIGNGVATVSGLPNVSIDEIVTFPTGVEGMALNLERKRVDLIMLGAEEGIRGGDLVQATGARLKVPVGSQFLGRVIDPLGNPVDRDEPIDASERRLFSDIAADVIKRSPVNESLFTGNLLKVWVECSPLKLLTFCCF